MKQFLKEIEKIAKLGIYETDIKSGTWVGSENFIEMFGLPKKKVYSIEELKAIIHPEDVDSVIDFYNYCLKNRKDFDYEYRCIKKNGDILHVLNRSSIRYSMDGEPLRILGLKQDITDRKKLEAKLLDLNKMVAHDLRNPIAQIEGIVNLLELKESEDQKKFKALLFQVTNNAKNIISKLINVSQFSLQQEDMSININNPIEQSLKSFNIQANKKKIKIKSTLSNNIWLDIDEVNFKRIIDNLLSNAIKFSTENSIIHIVSKIKNEKLSISIKDTGIGIPEENIPLLFTKLSKKKRRKGTHGEESCGLGLSIVKEIVDKYNGSINVKSRLGKGTTFIVEFVLSSRKTILCEPMPSENPLLKGF